jgi:hypothetical protein
VTSPLARTSPAAPHDSVEVPCRCGGAGNDLRCGCGSLLARKVQGGVELKCRRCKRTVVVPVTEA